MFIHILITGTISNVNVFWFPFCFPFAFSLPHYGGWVVFGIVVFCASKPDVCDLCFCEDAVGFGRLSGSMYARNSKASPLFLDLLTVFLNNYVGLSSWVSLCLHLFFLFRGVRCVLLVWLGLCCLFLLGVISFASVDVCACDTCSLCMWRNWLMEFMVPGYIEYVCFQLPCI